MKKILFILLIVLAVGFNTEGFSKGIELTGAGATFPYPLYSKMFNEYHKLTGTKVNYQAIGSGGGIRQLRAKTVDFGASDAFVNDEGLKKFSSPVVHIPMTAGAVVVVYNLPGNPQLKLTPKVLAEIFLGKIKVWNDKKIAELNKGVQLPSFPIMVAHRSDGSGTTFIFTDYLSKVCKDWKEKVGKGKSVKWPVGLGGKGNQGVAGLVKNMPGAIGYVELAYAIQNNMPYAILKNKAGNFVKPSLDSVSKAANIDLPDDMRVTLTDTDAINGYPISGFTWILVYKNLEDGKLSEKKAKELVNLLKWMLTDGQKYCEPLHYAPLSEVAQQKALTILKTVKYKGKVLLQ